MEYIFNVDSAVSLDPAARRLRVSGWLLARDKSAIKAVRLHGTGLVVEGKYGLPRPDVAQAHPGFTAGAFSGFSIQTEVARECFPLALEAMDQEGCWHGIRSLQAGDFIPAPPSRPIAPRPSAAGLAANSVPLRPVLVLEEFPVRGRIVVSVLFYYREDLMIHCLEALVPQLQKAAAGTGAQITLVCVLNYPASAEIVANTRALLARLDTPGGSVQLEIDQPGFNQGFGAGHNRVFALHESDLFVMVNSDVRIDQSDWLDQVVALFSRRPLAIAGLISTATRLDADGSGHEVGNPLQEDFDYVDGSLLVVNSLAGRQLGLFAEAYRFFYFEDADLCLRFRQAGFEPALLDLPYHHDRSSSARLFPRPLIQGMLDHNRARFFDAWEPFLKMGSLSRRIAVHFQPQNAAQQCASLPALFGLLRDHPAASIDLIGVHPTLRQLFHHSQWTVVEGISGGESASYYQIHRLDEPAESDLPLAQSISRKCRTMGDFKTARKHLESLCPPVAEPTAAGGTLVMVARDTPFFQGLRPSTAALERIAATRKRAGPVVVYTELPRYLWPKVWGEATLLEAATLKLLLGQLRAHHLLVTTDHWVLQLAQLLDAPSFAWFGATDPAQRIWNWSTCGAFTAPGLDCLGCHQTLGTSFENVCVRADLACMGEPAVDLFLDQLAAYAAQRQPPAWLQAAWSRPAFAAPRRPSAGLDLARWRSTGLEKVLVLIATKPGLPAQNLRRCRELAERALAPLANSRVILDDRGEAPARGSHVTRQAALAAIRQGMIERHLRDEHWVFWVDADIVDYPESLIIDLIHRAEGGIAAPIILMEGSADEGSASPDGFGPGRFFDVAGFVEEGRWASFTPPYFRQVGPIFELESVGSCYLVNADIYRHGGRHEADPLSREFVATGKIWPANAVSHSQKVHALAYTEHYSVCSFARAQGVPVRAFADLIAYHERVE